MSTLDGYIRRYVSVSAVIDTLRRKELVLLDPQFWDDRNDRNFMRLYKSSIKAPSLYAMCAAQCTETYAHWRVFTPGSEGACIEVMREPLEKRLRKNGFRYGPVEYLPLAKVKKLGPKDLERLPFCKRAGFGPEDEYRVVASLPSNQAAAFGLEIHLSWIKRIELNPWMPRPIAASVRATLRELPGCANLATAQSTLIDNETWRDAGNRVVGLDPEKSLVRFPTVTRRSTSQRTKSQ